ncbi:MAG: hypothetical protein HY059_15220 [Proteobacteria bacterium]|nr:hypothetical protein [Pseudomonadota bacterium]
MIAAIVAAILALTAGPAFAQGRGLVPADAVDPSRIRYVTTTDAKSKCVGLSRTPICAIETLIGCVERVRYVGCDRFNSSWVRKTTSPARVEYIFLRYGRINPRRLRAAIDAEGPDEFGRGPFNGFQAHVLTRDCPDDRSSCAGIPWLEGLYTIGPHRGRWIPASISLYRADEDYID